MIKTIVTTILIFSLNVMAQPGYIQQTGTHGSHGTVQSVGYSSSSQFREPSYDHIQKCDPQQSKKPKTYLLKVDPKAEAAAAAEARRKRTENAFSLFLLREQMIYRGELPAGKRKAELSNCLSL